MKLSLDAKVRRSDQVVSHEFEGAVYILDPNKNTVRALNDTAGFIWNSLEKRKTVASLIADVADKFEGERNKISQDTVRYLSKLVRLGHVSVVKPF